MRCPKASICSFQVFLGTLRFRLGLGQKESVFSLHWVKIDWGQRLAPLTCVCRVQGCQHSEPVASDVVDRRLVQGRPAVWKFCSWGTWFGLLRVLYWVRSMREGMSV